MTIINKAAKKSTLAEHNRLIKLAVPTTGKNSKRFTVGNKKGVGGKKPGSGRPTKASADKKLQVLEMLRLESSSDLRSLNAIIKAPDCPLDLQAKILMWKLNKTVPDLKQFDGEGLIVQIFTNLPRPAVIANRVSTGNGKDHQG